MKIYYSRRAGFAQVVRKKTKMNASKTTIVHDPIEPTKQKVVEEHYLYVICNFGVWNCNYLFNQLNYEIQKMIKLLIDARIL